MALHFPYHLTPMAQPVASLGGRFVRPRPVIWVMLVGPRSQRPFRALIDTGADDTVFPESTAIQLGVDLSSAPTARLQGVGRAGASLRFGRVALRITDGQETRQWDAWVGFTPAALPHPVLGFSGFLQFFTATFRGDREEVELTVNSLYAGI